MNNPLSSLGGWRGWVLIALLLAGASGVTQAATPPPSTADDLLQYLDQTIDWYRHVTSLDQTSLGTAEVLYRDSVHDNAQKALHLAFDYARAQAKLIVPDAHQAGPGGNKTSHAQNLAKATAAATGQVKQVQSDIDQISQQLANAPPDQAAILLARRDKLNSELNLAKARQQVLQNLSEFVNGPDAGTADALLKKIDDLEGSVPVPPATPPAGSAASVAAPAQPTIHPEARGVLGLITEMFSLSSRMGELKQVADQAAKLSQQNEKLREPIKNEWMDANRRSQGLATTQESSDINRLQNESQQLDDLAARLTNISAAGLPLNKQGVAINAARTALLDWHSALGKQYSHALRAVLIRISAISLTILVLLAISKIWSRATYRYVTDSRRRVQLLLLRRVVISIVIIVVIIAGIVSEIGSLATFAGLITAGIAVALQGVILSAAAYFFFIGRYGVRVGDRVTISGITGDVVDTGLLRLYLMELGGSGRDLSSTGRIVVFSNSVLFQNSPFFKQIPGADYIWNEVALTLSPDTDYHLAEQRLMGAVESIYAEYKDTIERQYENVRDSLHVQIAPPKLEGRMRFIDAGIEFVVRYPVEIRRTAEINDRITRKLLETVDQEPKLRMVSSGTPRIQPANGQPHPA